MTFVSKDLLSFAVRTIFEKNMSGLQLQKFVDQLQKSPVLAFGQFQLLVESFDGVQQLSIDLELPSLWRSQQRSLLSRCGS